VNISALAVERLLGSRLVGIVRLDDPELAVAASAVAIEAGVKSIEITFTIPHAAAVIERLRGNYPTTLIGAGTIRQLSELKDAAAAGAQFLVAPGLNPSLLEAAQKCGLPMLPGVFTASEIDLDHCCNRFRRQGWSRPEASPLPMRLII
jgi:2-dehydro-3-deoxyphosphogluconate aldolase/(4S)-4-hydroxy-2-oxoglutarate aldolase